MKPGTYVARATEWDLGTTDNGKDYIGVLFRIEEGEAVGQTITWYGYFTEKTEQRTIESLRYCGWEGHNFADLNGLDKNLVKIVVDEEEYEGRIRTKVQWINRLGSMAIKNVMDDKARAAFAARMKGAAMAISKDLAKGVDSGRPERAGSQADQTAPEHCADNMEFPGDDLPF
jgi:hypothetical protein